MQTKTRIFATIVVGIALLAGAVGVTPIVSHAANAPQKVAVLIGFTNAPGPNEQALVRSQGGVIKHSYHLVPAIAASVPESAISGLLRNPHVTSVDLDGTIYAIDTELDNTWGVKRISAGALHDAGNKGMDVKVAVIDTGIDYNHSDLAANYSGGYDFVNNDTDPMDDNGHGTHVAGTIAALDNNVGVVGIAPEAKLYALKVLNSSGSGSFSDVIAALQWAVDNGIQVTNNSYGSESNPGGIVQVAFDNSAAMGVLHIAAAGNSGNHKGIGNNVGYPAAYNSVVAVAATDKNDNRASFSSTGNQVELTAPGVTINSTKLGGGYIEYSGTSMASPHVAGSAALVIAAGITDKNGNGLINDEVRQALNNTALDLGVAGRDTLYGFGLVNVAAAVASTAPPATGTISGTVTDTTLSPISDAIVTDGTRSATTDVNGAYTLTSVPIGTYTVTASANDYNSVSQTNVGVTANTTTTINFALTAIVYGTIDGTVIDAVTLTPISGATVIEGARQAVTDSIGHYTISGVPAGIYAVTASAVGYQNTSQSVAVTGNTTSTANFSLQAVSQATTVSVVDPIVYTTAGGKNNDRHLLITVALVDNLSNAVVGASVSIDLYLNGSVIRSGTSKTGTNGTATFTLKNAPSGHYETKVTGVSATGLTWDGITPTNGF